MSLGEWPDKHLAFQKGVHFPLPMWTQVEVKNNVYPQDQ
jgi:hypothetical protein